jgi:long-chain acyl-CoA synthetase
VPHLSKNAELWPDKPAIIVAETGEIWTYGELDRSSLKAANALMERGLKRLDAVALFMDNCPEYLEAAWAVQRSGLLDLFIPYRSTADEAAYMVGDSKARVLIVSGDAAIETLRDLVAEKSRLIPSVEYIFVVGVPPNGCEDWRTVREAAPAVPIRNATAGSHILYSSGTTGRPKALRWVLPEVAPEDDYPFDRMLTEMFGVGPEDIYLSTAPLYHTAPISYCLGVHQLGATVVLMKSFDAERSLNAIERYKVTFAQYVPTMFVRMLKLPQEAKQRYDLSSLKVAIHSAAPCAPEIKHDLICWWGPVVWECYGGSEGNGFTLINSEEWLKKPGSVGKAYVGHLHICDEWGKDLGPGEVGTIYFSGGDDFEYVDDPVKTASSKHPIEKGRTTLADIGYLDEYGYLFLTDRQAFTIISGGVNVYPLEVENLLIIHPKVADVAVFGIPDPDLGEVVHVIVEPVDWADAGPELEQQLMELCAAQLSRIKCPKAIEFNPSLPRTPTGKMMKRLLKEPYWANRKTMIG